MTTNVVPILPSSTAEYWRDRIVAQHAKSVEAIIATGSELIRAKAELKHGEWGRLTGETTREPLLPFSAQTARRLMQIAKHAALSNRAHARDLPASWYTLAIVAQLPARIVEQHLAAGVLHPELTRADAQALVDEHTQAQRPRATAPMWPNVPDAACKRQPTPPDLTPEREAELDDMLAAELKTSADAMRERAALEATVRHTTAIQGAWAETFGRLRALADVAIDIQASLENRLQPLPAPDGVWRDQLQAHVDQLQRQVRTLCSHITTTYLEPERTHAHH